MNDQDLKKIANLLDNRIEESEKKIANLLDTKLAASEKRITEEIGDFIEQNILPQLEEKADKSDIDRIERKLDHFSAKIVEHDKRLGNIESLPVIVHELKARKLSS